MRTPCRIIENSKRKKEKKYHKHTLNEQKSKANHPNQFPLNAIIPKINHRQ